MGARFFLLTGGAVPAGLLERAAAHGTLGRAVMHAAPHPGPGCYGAVEIKLATMCNGVHRWVSKPHAVVCKICDATMPGVGARAVRR